MVRSKSNGSTFSKFHDGFRPLLTHCQVSNFPRVLSNRFWSRYTSVKHWPPPSQGRKASTRRNFSLEKSMSRFSAQLRRVTFLTALAFALLGMPHGLQAQTFSQIPALS